jgi:ATP-dependent DNA ligase
MGRMVQTLDPVSVAVEWRPQRYAHGLSGLQVDAVVEPFWGGPRLLAAIGPGAATLVHNGRPIPARSDLVEALAASLSADAVVIEGHVTAEAFGTGEGAFPVSEMPTGNLLRMVVGPLVPGRRERALRAAAAARAREEEQEATALAVVDGPEQVAFVATDLLWLDGESLLDVPLLERKRLLEGSISQSYLVRLTTYVQVTSHASLVAWRSLGFTHLVYRATNGRYLPGEVNPACMTAPTPTDTAGVPRAPARR